MTSVARSEGAMRLSPTSEAEQAMRVPSDGATVKDPTATVSEASWKLGGVSLDMEPATSYKGSAATVVTSCQRYL